MLQWAEEMKEQTDIPLQLDGIVLIERFYADETIIEKLKRLMRMVSPYSPLPEWKWPMMRRRYLEHMLEERGLDRGDIWRVIDDLEPFDRRGLHPKNHFYDLRELAGKFNYHRRRCRWCNAPRKQWPKIARWQANKMEDISHWREPWWQLLPASWKSSGKRLWLRRFLDLDGYDTYCGWFCKYYAVRDYFRTLAMLKEATRRQAEHDERAKQMRRVLRTTISACERQQEATESRFVKYGA